MTVGRRNAIFFVFSLSGFAGLVYESLWTHYLKLFLGHAAYAQMLVLAIFMGGLAVGSWMAAKWSEKIKNPLAAYAFAELLLGAAAYGWHSEFTHATRWALDSLLPALPSPAAAGTAQFVLSAALIFPQTLVLGATFPLLSAALLRAFPKSSGHSLAMLYFTNSIGGVVGMLASGFVLIPKIGLPGAMLVAAMCNAVAGLVAWILSRTEEAPPLLAADAPPGSLIPRLRVVMWVAAFLTGASSFMYEVGWIRMLSLVLGASTHAFELMVSAFILGLALGGLWVKKRIDTLDDKTAFAGYVQLAMGLLALATLPVFAHSFDVMAFVIRSLPKTDWGYACFNLISHLIAASVMVPATFCAGMTLPLFTAVLISAGGGEKAVGEIYTFNTAGAIAGVAFAIAVGMPVLGLKGLCITGAVVDAMLGFYLLWNAGFSRNGGRIFSAFAAATALVVIAVPFRSETLASGAYHNGVSTIGAGNTVEYHKDGRTATISLVRTAGGVLSLVTNGKVDASIAMRPGAPPAWDEPTQTLIGALPLLVSPDVKSVVCIGMGSGFTSRVLLASPSVQSVDTVEIEPNIVEAARHFGLATEKVFDDPRSRIHINDGKSFFAVRHKKYDLIISEPSNPWVSGVSGLFSKEFYSIVSRNLAPGGLYVQWMHLYSTDMSLFASVINAIDDNFDDWVIYSINAWDVMVIGRNGIKIPRPALGAASPEMAGLLGRIGVRTDDDLRLLRLGDKKLLEGVFRKTGVNPNSDYFPFLDANSVKARYLKTNFLSLLKLRTSDLPILEMLEGATSSGGRAEVTDSPYYEQHRRAASARMVGDYLIKGTSLPNQLPEETRRAAETVKNPGCGPGQATALLNVARAVVAYLPSEELMNILSSVERSCGENDLTRLIKGVSMRDGAAMSAAAERFLEEADFGSNEELRRFVLEAAMLGHLAKGDNKAALAVFKKHPPVLSRDAQPDFDLVFLFNLANN